MKNYKDILKELEQYQDKYGFYHVQLVDSERNPSTQNGILWTAMCLIMLKNNGMPQNEIEAYWKGKALSLEVVPGVYRRFPGSDENNSMDNLAGMLACCELANDKITPMLIYQHGKNFRGKFVDIVTTYEEHLKQSTLLTKVLKSLFGHCAVSYVYTVHNPKETHWFGWFSRSPAVVGHLKRLSNVPTTFIEDLVTVAGILISGYMNPNNRDAYALPWVTSYYIKDKSFLFSLCYKFFMSRVHKQFGVNGLGKHLRVMEPNHPLAKYHID